MSDLNAALFQPVRLPRVRDRLVRHFLEEDLARTVLTRLAKANMAWLPGTDVGQPDEFAVMQRGPVADEHARSFTTHVGTALADATLYRIGKQFIDLINEAAADLPDLHLTPDQLPAPAGIVFYEKPLFENTWQDERGDRTVSGTTAIDAVGWFTVEHGVWMMMFVIPDKVMPEAALHEVRDSIGYLLMHSPGGGLRFGGHEDIHKKSPAIARLLATLFLLRQPGVAHVTPAPVDRDLQRKYKRAKRAYPDVHVVDLRRRPVPEGREAPTPGREYNVRWLVRGHWRDQAHGKGRTLRRRIYIAPHLKGPDDAPIKAHPETVYKLP